MLVDCILILDARENFLTILYHELTKSDKKKVEKKDSVIANNTFASHSTLLHQNMKN